MSWWGKARDRRDEGPHDPFGVDLPKQEFDIQTLKDLQTARELNPVLQVQASGAQGQEIVTERGGNKYSWSLLSHTLFGLVVLPGVVTSITMTRYAMGGHMQDPKYKEAIHMLRGAARRKAMFRRFRQVFAGRYSRIVKLTCTMSACMFLADRILTRHYGESRWYMFWGGATPLLFGLLRHPSAITAVLRRFLLVFVAPVALGKYIYDNADPELVKTWRSYRFYTLTGSLPSTASAPDFNDLLEGKIPPELLEKEELRLKQ